MSESKQALIPIMNGQMEQIAAIEQQWGIRFAEGDHRPRIEHFHDAVRALTSGTQDPYGKHSRLSVEHLAYDLGQLRQIQSNPIGGYSRAKELSPGADVAVTNDINSLKPSGPNRQVRSELAQYYKDYTVLFVALFAEIADINFQARGEEVDNMIADIALVEEIVTKLANGAMSPAEANIKCDQIESENLRNKILQLINHSDVRQAEVDKVMLELKMVEDKLNAEKQIVDQAHLNYVTGQLAVYEEAKDTVKRLAAQGMNIAGQHVEAAMQQAAGRGQGRGY